MNRKEKLEEVIDDCKINTEKGYKLEKVLKILIEAIRDFVPEEKKEVFTTILKSLTYWG